MDAHLNQAESEKPQTSYKQIVKSSALTGGSTVVDIVLRIGRVKVLAVLLGPEGVGLLGLYTSIVQTVTAVATLGAETSGVREIANAYISGQPTRAAQVSHALRSLLCISGLIGTLALCIGARAISQLSFGSGAYSYGIISISLGVGFGALLASFRAELQGARRIGDLALVSVLSSCLGTVAAISIIWLWRSKGIAPLVTVTAGISAATTWWIARRLPFSRGTRKFRQILPDQLSLLRLGFGFLFSAVVGNAIAYFTRVLITRDLGADYAGYYQAAAALSVLYVGFIMQAMGSDFFPRLSQAESTVVCNQLVNEQTEVGLLLATPGVLATLTFAPLVIYLFYSPKFAASVELLRWQVLGVFLQVLTWPMGYVLPARGKARLFLYTEIAAYTVQVLLIWVGVRVWGLAGAGIAYFVYYMLYGVFIFFVVRAQTAFGFSKKNLRLAALAIPAILVVFLSQMLVSRAIAIAVGSAATVFFGVYTLKSLGSLLGARSQKLEVIRRWLVRFKQKISLFAPL